MQPRNHKIRTQTLLSLLVLCTLLTVSFCEEEDIQQKRLRIQREQLNNREAIQLKYGENTETLTFAIYQIQDFVVKSGDYEEVKAVTHCYWKEDNVYISSEYREGENVRVLVYEDNTRILVDSKFYTTTGFKFMASQNRNYTIRFIDQGKISKLIALQLTQLTSLKTEQRNKANRLQIQTFNSRLWGLVSQIKIMSSLSEFSIVMSEKNYGSLTTSIDMYMIYLIIEAVIILVIVGFQVKVMTGLLKEESVV